jgi:hypothetical protein
MGFYFHNSMGQIQKCLHNHNFELTKVRTEKNSHGQSFESTKVESTKVFIGKLTAKNG